MVLQFVGEYVVAFLVESLSDRTGFLVFKRYDVFALRARFVAFLVEPQLKSWGSFFYRCDAVGQSPQVVAFFSGHERQRTDEVKPV